MLSGKNFRVSEAFFWHISGYTKFCGKYIKFCGSILLDNTKSSLDIIILFFKIKFMAINNKNKTFRHIQFPTNEDNKLTFSEALTYLALKQQEQSNKNKATDSIITL